MLGHYLMDHIAGGSARGEFPDIPATPTLDGPNRPCGIYIPRFRNLPNGARSKEFLRGYGYEGGANVEFNRNAGGFGETYKQRVCHGVNVISIEVFGEVLGRWENYVDIDLSLCDAYGIPALKFHMTHSENEFAMLRDSVDSAAEMLEAAGAKNIHTRIEPRPPGGVRHEVGVARMGENPKTSVLNQFQQTHDIKNLFVMDAAGFPSNPCQNPTLTIMALCVRSCDYLLDELKKGNL